MLTRPLSFFICFLGIHFNAFSAAPLQITEFSADNTAEIKLDDFGRSPDWIEIHNPSPVSTSLEGFFLTDDPNVPTLWRFPAASIPAQGYLLVFASGRNLANANAPLHTNFQLKKTTGYLALVDRDGKTVIDSVSDYPEQRSNHSYGQNGDSLWKYQLAPTPGKANAGATVPGFVEEVHFSQKPGFYKGPLSVHLSCETPGATIRYTTNGSLPTLTSGLLYTGPVTFSKTTTLRAAAWKEGLGPAPSTTRTFIYLENVLTQTGEGFPTNWSGVQADYAMDPLIMKAPMYQEELIQDLLSLPTVSIVMDIDHLFGPQGIYSNPTNETGPFIEQPGSLEYINPKTGNHYQVNCGFRMHGRASRSPANTDKHSFRAVFRSEYGPSRLKEKFFPESGLASFDTIIFRATFNDAFSWFGLHYENRIPQYLRDPFARSLQRTQGRANSHTGFVHLYVNGLYWGLHNPSEKPAAPFAASYFGGEKEDYDAINSAEAIDGTITAWNTLISKAGAGLAGANSYLAIQDYLDVTSFADYIIVNLFVGNNDWPEKNWLAVRRRADKAPFHFMCWDGEWTLGTGANENQMGTIDVPNTPGGLFFAIRQNAEWRLLLADRLQKHLFNEGVLTTNATMSLYRKMGDEIFGALVPESARWGDNSRPVTYTREIDWIPERDRIVTNYLAARTQNVLNHFKTANLFPQVNAPLLNRHGGKVEPGFSVTMTGTGKLYFTTNGSDPRVAFTGAVSPVAAEFAAGSPIQLQSSTVIKARAFHTNTWSALTEAVFQVNEVGLPLKFTEIMYHPAKGEALEYLELQNFSTVPLDIGGFYLEGVECLIPLGTVIPPGGVLLIASDLSPAYFMEHYHPVVPEVFFSGRLSDKGQQIQLRKPSGELVISLTYSDESPWPASADGTGFSLELADPKSDPADGSSWRASHDPSGTPGLPPATFAPSLLLNEILADNQGSVPNGKAKPDYVEIFNSSNASIDLKGWSLQDGSGNRFTIQPSTPVAPGSFLLVWFGEPAADSTPGLFTGFGLSRKGDTVLLLDPADRRVDGIRFGAQLPDLSIGRIGETWKLTKPTPLAINQPTPVAPADSLTLNEWMFKSPAGESDWIELHNQSDLPAELCGLYLQMNAQGYRYPYLTFLAGKKFIALQCDEDPNPDHVTLTLPVEGGRLSLYDAAGHLIEEQSVSPQVAGVAEGRLPDGASTVASFPHTASPGASNYGLNNAGLVINEILARNGGVAPDPWGGSADFVELVNLTGAPLPLSGFGLGLDMASSRWTIPQGVSLPANGHLTIWFDSAQPTSKTAAGPLNAGLNLPGEGGSLFLFKANGQVVDVVRFGHQVVNHSLGRGPTNWSLLSTPTPGAANSAAVNLSFPNELRINEWMADDSGWFEFYNTSPNPVALEGLILTDGDSQSDVNGFMVRSNSFIGGFDFVVFRAEGTPGAGSDHVNFKLDPHGDSLSIIWQQTNIVDQITFGLQRSQVSEGRLPDGASQWASFDQTPTPAASNYLLIQQVAFNELLSHPGGSQEQAIELLNLTSQTQSLADWFLSDDPRALKKFKIPAGTSLASTGFKVFYEQSFGGSFKLNPFTGGTVWLSQADTAGNLTGYRQRVNYGGSEKGVSLGRHLTSQGADFIRLTRSTLGKDTATSLAEFRTGTGLPNAGPILGPLIFSEIMSTPADPVDAEDFEFLELQNVSNETIRFAAVSGHSWRLLGGVDFTFPSDLVLASGERMVVVAFDPSARPDKLSAFREHYKIFSSVPILGPYSGKLNDEGEVLALLKPGEPEISEGVERVPELILERIHFGQSTSWPTPLPGESLHRLDPVVYGNHSQSWRLGPPTAGRSGEADTDLDGLPDAWEMEHFGNLTFTTGGQDSDQDGATNASEYGAGTDPRNAASYLHVRVRLVNGLVVGTFNAAGGKNYIIQKRPALTNPLQPWDTQGTVPAGEPREIQWEVPAIPGTQLFWRVLVQ